MVNQHNFECVVINTHDFEVKTTHQHNFEYVITNAHNFEFTLNGFATSASTVSRVTFISISNIEMKPTIIKYSFIEFNQISGFEISPNVPTSPQIEFAQISNIEITPSQSIDHDGLEWVSQSGWEMITKMEIEVDSGGEYAMVSAIEMTPTARSYFMLNNYSGSLLSDLDALTLVAMDYVAV